MRRLIFVLLIGLLVWKVAEHHRSGNARLAETALSATAPQSHELLEAPVAEPVVPLTSTAFRCDGRTMCSQMHSCDEATYFVQNCPGVKMDGNHDGIPCERQWCN